MKNKDYITTDELTYNMLVGKIEQLEQENQQLKKQKDDVVEYIKEECLGKNLVDDDVRNDTFKELLRMLGEIDD